MTPEAKGATAEGFTRGEHRPTVRGEARPEDWNEAPRRRASEHSRERPEGEGVKPHPRKSTRPANSIATKKPTSSHVVQYPEGGEGGAERPPWRSQHQRQHIGLCHTGEITPTATGSSGKACVSGTPLARLTRRRTAGRTATPISGRAGGVTHGVRTYALPPSGDNAVRFRHPAKRGRAPSGPAPKRIFKGII